ncbi:C40 family peptidase [uncultured Formosa sp.]|uniref:C40 family peptidase n=1 Tax=uncultured Formosa sp. TaxID=255435 RepID=UPI00262E2A17|nr:C40 family peptidase [uncultured Formosa sp.]
MHKLSILFCLLICVSSCKSSKKATSYKRSTEVSIPSKSVERTKNRNSDLLTPENTDDLKPLSIELINYAKQFEGVKYKYGGTTTKGMDCSGLVYETFKAYDINLPRVSRDMAQEGSEIDIENVKAGDLLFFHTNPKRNTINHVGLVVSSRTGSVEFIHASTSKGVIISSLAERYWYYSFKEARRIL